MIRIAIVEDDKKYQNQLVQYIRRYTEETGREIDIKGRNIIPQDLDNSAIWLNL